MITRTRSAGLDGIDLGADSGIDEPMVSTIVQAGLSVYVWTVKDATEASRLREAGIQGLTTARPGWLRGQLS